MCRLFWKENLELLRKRKHKELVANLSRMKEEVWKVVSLCEKSLAIRLTVTQRVSNYMTITARFDGKLMHTLELISRIGLSTKFHRRQKSKVIEMLRQLNQNLKDLEAKMEVSFDTFKGHFKICDSYYRICDNLLEILRMDKIPWKNIRDQVSSLPKQRICCHLGLPRGTEYDCQDINNNNNEGVCLDLVNKVLEQDWKEDILIIEKQVEAFQEYYKYFCSIYAIKDDWKELNVFDAESCD